MHPAERGEDMATAGRTASRRTKRQSAMAWTMDMLNDPRHRDAIEELMTELDVRQDLIQLREQTGLTQVQLAERLGTTQSVIARLEGKKTANVELKTLVRVAAALGARVRISFERIRTASRAKAAG